MNLAIAYSQVIRYRVVSDEELLPFIDPTKPEVLKDIPTAKHGLADFLEEQEDPRAAVVNRALGITNPPKGYTGSNGWVFKGANKNLNHPDADEFYVVLHNKPNNAYRHQVSNMSFAPVVSSYAKHAAGVVPDAVYVSANLYPEKANYLTGHHAGIFTPDEVREIADRLPEEDAARVHRMLDRNFGKRTE